MEIILRQLNVLTVIIDAADLEPKDSRAVVAKFRPDKMNSCCESLNVPPRPGLQGSGF